MPPEDFRSRLARLRKDSPSATPGKGMPDWLKSRLNEKQRARMAAAAEDWGAELGRTVGEPAGLVGCENEHGDFAARETVRDAASRHGDFRLDEVFAADPRAISLLAGDRALDELDFSRAVFLDTETTGLSGGAGVYVYMVGLGSFQGGRFHVWQGFLRGPGEEHGLLTEVAERIAAADAVVSFFGKSFDRHRLEDKMRIAGVTPPFADRPHLDLYHPFQRLTKGRLPDGRLQTMESRLCGHERTDDLPGSMAPAAWFDYLAGRAHRLEGVFTHNLEDVLSLVSLGAYLGRTLEGRRMGGEPLVGCAIGRARAFARSFKAAGDDAAAFEWLERAIALERALGKEPRDLEFARAEHLRRGGRSDEARSAFEALLERPADVYTAPALLAFAKLLEHRLRDLPAALEACEHAAKLLDRHHVGRDYARLARDVEARSVRLLKKVGARR